MVSRVRKRRVFVKIRLAGSLSQTRARCRDEVSLALHALSPREFASSRLLKISLPPNEEEKKPACFRPADLFATSTATTGKDEARFDRHSETNRAVEKRLDHIKRI